MAAKLGIAKRILRQAKKLGKFVPGHKKRVALRLLKKRRALQVRVAKVTGLAGAAGAAGFVAGRHKRK